MTKPFPNPTRNLSLTLCGTLVVGSLGNTQDTVKNFMRRVQSLADANVQLLPLPGDVHPQSIFQGTEFSDNVLHPPNEGKKEYRKEGFENPSSYTRPSHWNLSIPHEKNLKTPNPMDPSIQISNNPSHVKKILQKHRKTISRWSFCFASRHDVFRA